MMLMATIMAIIMATIIAVVLIAIVWVIYDFLSEFTAFVTLGSEFASWAIFILFVTFVGRCTTMDLFAISVHACGLTPGAYGSPGKPGDWPGGHMVHALGHCCTLAQLDGPKLKTLLWAWASCVLVPVGPFLSISSMVPWFFAILTIALRSHF